MRLLLLWSLTISSDAFQLKSLTAPLAVRTEPVKRSRLMISSGLLPEADECIVSESESPSTIFGRPIHDDIRALNKNLIKQAKTLLFDNLFQGSDVSRCYAKFYALENIARMPYFSYVSVLHLYESLGRWRKAEYLKVHFSESWNEQHHLLIMEEMGGSERWTDRFVSQHIAFFYYWIVIGLYMYNPTLAYNINQAVEEEAHMTYSNFLVEHEEFLQSQPAPTAAKNYYTSSDLYMFDAMHFNEHGDREIRRPKMETLYDAFSAVRDDEWEHVKTMVYLQDDACREPRIM